MHRVAKQFLYGGVFLLIVFGVAWQLYRVAVPAPTCTDGMQNQAEEGLDCGAVCGKSCPVVLQPLKNLPVQLIHYGNDSYDALAHLENPNATYGASRVSFTLKVTDASGATLTTRTGSTYVNPAQPRYLVFPLLGITGQPASAALQFASAEVQWGALTIDQAGAVQFPVRQEQLQPSANSFRYTATVTNRSNFDFNHVDIAVILYDAAGTIVGTGATTLDTVVAQETRGFVIDWPFPIPTAVRAQTIATTNIFDNANYLRTYGAPQPSQGF